MAYLGYIVGGGKLQPMVDNLQVLRDTVTPTKKKQVRKFLGLAGYYRFFVSGFKTRDPLSDLTKNSQLRTMQWSNKCEKTFLTWKTWLAQEPILMHPDFSKVLIL